MAVLSQESRSGFFHTLGEKWKIPAWKWSAMAILFLVVSLGLWFGLSVRKSVLSPLAISGMTLSAETSDGLGVDPGSAFLLRSVAEIAPEAVQDRLSVSPAVPFTTRSRSANEVEVTFDQPLKGGSVYAFKLSTDDTSADAAKAASEDATGFLSWAFQTKRVFAIEKTLPGDRAIAVPLSAGIEVTFTDEHFTDAEDFFQIEPAVKGRFERHRKTLVFVPEKLSPKTLYTVTMKAGVGVEGSGDTLASDRVFRFETAAEEQYAGNKRLDISSNWYSGMAIYQFGLGATPAFSVAASGFETSSIGVSVYRFPDEDAYLSALRSEGSIPSWTRYARANMKTDEQGLAKVASFQADLESSGWKQYFLFPEPLPEGRYFVVIESDGAKAHGFFQMTDVAAYAAASDTETLVWANRVGGAGAPIAGASVEIFSGAKQESLSGVTDGNGLLSAPTPGFLKDGTAPEASFMRIASSDGKSVIVPVESNANYASGASPRSEAYWSYLYLDRETYQPTDTLAFWGVLRKRDASAPERLKLKMLIDGKEQRIETSEWGTFIGEIPIKELPVGYYSAQVYMEGDDPDTDTALVTVGFSVETYTKPAYRITLYSEKPTILQDESARFSGKVEFFDGTPVPGVEFTTGYPEKKMLTTDNDGGFSFEQRFSDMKSPGRRSVSVAPTSGEEGDITAETSVVVFPSTIGLSTEETRDGLRQKISLKAFEIDFKKANAMGGATLGYGSDASAYAGAAVSGNRIVAKVKEISFIRKEDGEFYDFIEKKKIKRYRYEREEKKLPEQALVTGDDGKVAMELSLSDGKGYEVVFEATSSDGRKTVLERYFYGYTSSSEPDYALVPKQDANHKYHLDEAVELSFGKTDDSALPSGSRFLFYRAQRGLRDAVVQSDASYRFSYAERDVPNVEIRGVMFTGTTYIERLTGVRFDQEDRELSLSVSADKPSYRPGDTVNLDVSVKDPDGNGRPAKVNLSAVDEAQLAVAPHEPSLMGDWNGMYRSVGGGIIAAYASHQYPNLKDMAERGGCFLPGTPILMSDGSEKPIESIAVGDSVSSRVSESDPMLRAGSVTQIFRHVVDGYLVINGFLHVTPEHNIFSNGRWVMAGELRIGDKVLLADNHWERINSIEKRGERVTVHNFSVDTYHTYFADGVYVHNDKGRSVFLDRVLFSEIETDANGRGKTSFRAPDNLTSWRVASQAVTKDLFAGQSNELSVPVSLPFFVLPTFNTEYIAGDKPILSLRAFGTGVAKGDQVEFSIESESLGVKKTVSGKVFESSDAELLALPEGTHEITIGARSGDKTDKLTRTIRVVPEGTWRTETAAFPVVAGTEFRPGEHGRTTIMFSEQGMSVALSELWDLAMNGSGRFDGMVAGAAAKRILNESFGEKFDPASPDEWQPFVDGNKGYRLFPYGDADLYVTALSGVAGVRDMLPASDADIFQEAIESPESSRESVVVALLGRALRGDAVLLDVERMLSEKDLSVHEKLLLGVAESALGNGEQGKLILREALGAYEEHAVTIAVPSGESGSSEELEATALGAVIAVLSGMPEADQLFSYVNGRISRENPFFLERIAFLESKLKHAPKRGDVSISYSLNGERKEKTMKRGETFSLSLSQDDMRTLKIEKADGNVGATVVRTMAAEEGEGNALSGTLQRSYSVSGASKHELRSGDLVSVKFAPHIEAEETKPGECLFVTDTLPAGMKPVTSWHGLERESDGTVRIYPYSVEGQWVKFCIPTDRKKPVEYLARVSGKGEFSAPGTLVETSDGSRFKVFSGDRVTIK
jgi:hypothetical protein